MENTTGAWGTQKIKIKSCTIVQHLPPWLQTHTINSSVRRIMVWIEFSNLTFILMLLILGWSSWDIIMIDIRNNQHQRNNQHEKEKPQLESMQPPRYVKLKGKCFSIQASEIRHILMFDCILINLGIYLAFASMHQQLYSDYPFPTQGKGSTFPGKHAHVGLFLGSRNLQCHYVTGIWVIPLLISILRAALHRATLGEDEYFLTTYIYNSTNICSGYGGK